MRSHAHKGGKSMNGFQTKLVTNKILKESIVFHPKYKVYRPLYCWSWRCSHTLNIWINQPSWRYGYGPFKACRSPSWWIPISGWYFARCNEWCLHCLSEPRAIRTPPWGTDVKWTGNTFPVVLANLVFP